jgi:hypothetical protein
VTARSEQAPKARHEAGTPAEAHAAVDAYALAEAHRRAGRAAEAERVARLGLEREPRALRLRMLLALALLDQRRGDAARAELELGLAAPAEFPTQLSEQEFDAAFESAEPEIEHLMDADRVAERALREAELGPADEISPPGADSVFATRTMAELLERQGDRRGAARIRAALGDSGAQDAPVPDHTAAIAALERWLENVRRLQP